MSILIKGMEMPKNCAECEFHQSGYPDWCDLSIRARDIHNTEIRQEWCPLVEVPPHGRLVDADALKATFCAECNHTITCEDCDIDYHFGRLAPTIIEAEEGEEE